MKIIPTTTFYTHKEKATQWWTAAAILTLILIDRAFVLVLSIIYFFIALWFGWSIVVCKCDALRGGNTDRFRFFASQRLSLALLTIFGFAL